MAIPVEVSSFAPTESPLKQGTQSPCFARESVKAHHHVFQFIDSFRLSTQVNGVPWGWVGLNPDGSGPPWGPAPGYPGTERPPGELIPPPPSEAVYTNTA